MKGGGWPLLKSAVTGSLVSRLPLAAGFTLFRLAAKMVVEKAPVWMLRFFVAGTVLTGTT